MAKQPPSALRIARVNLGLTIRDLREMSGVCTGRLSMLERGLVQPNERERARLATALELSEGALFPCT